MVNSLNNNYKNPSCRRHNDKKTKSINIFRRLSCVFYETNKLDEFEAAPILTPEEVCISSAIQEIRQELIEIIKHEATKSKALTKYQRKVFKGILANKTTGEITKDLDYDNPLIGNYAVYVCLNGYSKRIKSGKRVGGMYRRLHKRLSNNPRVIELLEILEVIKTIDNYKVALTFLQTTESAEFWKDYTKEVRE